MIGFLTGAQNHAGGMTWVTFTKNLFRRVNNRTHYWEVGAGENVLMLHSADPGSGGGWSFAKILEALGRQFRVLAPDIIGFGKTDSPTRDLRHPRLCRTYGAISRCTGSEKDPLDRQLPRRIDQHLDRRGAPLTESGD